MEKISAIILAAGLSTRMKEFKQLLPYRGKKVIIAIVEELLNANVAEVLVVVGHNADLVREELKKYDVKLIMNPDYKQGMHTSVMAGAENVSDKADAFMIVLGDQPEISSRLVNGLIAFAKQSEKGIIIPSYLNKRGHPVLFRKQYLEHTKNLSPILGLKQIVNENPKDIDYFIAGEDTILFDIDTPEDYQQLLER